MERAKRALAVAIMLGAAASVAGTSVRRMRADEELPVVVSRELSRRPEIARAYGAPLRIVEQRVVSWDQDEMDATLTARMKIVGSSGLAAWVDVTAESTVGLPWRVRVERMRPVHVRPVRHLSSIPR